MPRFKEYNQGQTVMLPVSFDRQILPGTFEFTLNYLVDEKLDLSIFHHKYNNDDTLGIKRFSLRGKKKVNVQWQLMNMLHNLTKIHRFGMAV